MRTLLGYIGLALFLVVAGLGGVLVFKVATDPEAFRMFVVILVAFLAALLLLVGLGIGFLGTSYSHRNGARMAIGMVEAQARQGQLPVNVQLQAPQQDYPVTAYSSYAARIVAPSTEVQSS